MYTRSIIAISIVLVTFVTLIQSAHAGNSRSFFLGDEAALTGGAGVSVTGDSGSLWYNPAGLGGLTTGRMELTATVYSAKLRPLDNILKARLPSGTYSTDARADDFGSVPTSLVFVRNANERISYGAAWYQTRDEWLDFRADLQVPYDDTGQEWSEGIEYHQRAYVYHIGPAIGVQLSPRFRFGFSLFFVYGSGTASLRIFAGTQSGGDAPEDATLIALDQYAKAKELGITVTSGIQMEFAPDWHLGLVIRTPTWRIWESTDVSHLNSVSSAELSLGTYSYLTADDTKMTFGQIVPIECELGLAWKKKRDWLGFSFSARPPLEQAEQTALWNLSIGGRHELNRILSFGAGLFTDNRSDKQEPDNVLAWRTNRYGLTTGLEIRTPLTVKATPDEIAAGKTDRPLIWATTVAASWALEFAEYKSMGYDFETNELFVIGTEKGVFHQGTVYLGTALYF